MRNLQSTPAIHLNNTLHYSSVDTKKLKNEYKIQLVSEASDIRRDVELFIQASYKKHFLAHLSGFFPLILAVTKISDGSIIGALGLRYADEEELFSECYLNQPIEELIKENETRKIQRNKILELGNFVVRERSDIKNILPVFSQYIKSLDVDWVVYTLTQPIRFYFDKFALKLIFLQKADIKAVNGAASDWGRYYKFNPAVYYSSVQKNMNY